MNCRVCNTPAAPCELAFKGEDGKGMCVRCMEAKLQEIENRKRVLGCGYCGETFYTYPSVSEHPTLEDHKAAIAAFAKHDAECAANPVGCRMRAAEAACVAVWNRWKGIALELFPKETRTALDMCRAVAESLEDK